MPWEKKGNVYDPRQHRGWAGSHAQAPTVLVRDDVLRVYYADRNAAGQSFTSYLDLDRRDPSRVVYFHQRAVMPFGKPGTFDDEGVTPGCAMEHEGRVYLYYSGWNRRLTVPYHNATGLAVSDDGGQSFARMFEGPILDRVPLDPYLAVTPCVMKEGELWRMWYVSGVEWAEVAGAWEPVHVIKYAQSRDGIHWGRPNIVSVRPRHGREALSHPWVIKRDGVYRMWYGFRDSQDYRDGKGSYRIGYAESRTGVEFERMDDAAGITVSETGWDSTMICYPCVVTVDGKTYMFHNGNSFGQTGIGYALLG